MERSGPHQGDAEVVLLEFEVVAGVQGEPEPVAGAECEAVAGRYPAFGVGTEAVGTPGCALGDRTSVTGRRCDPVASRG